MLKFLKSSFVFLSASVIWLTALNNIYAHSVWIEDTADKQLMVRFGEYGDEVEKSPGHLDSLGAVTAWTNGADGKPVALESKKQSDGVWLVGAVAGKPALIEVGFPVMKRGDAPGRRPLFYARWHAVDAAAAKPALVLDIVPTGKVGEVRVYLRGQPVPEARLALHAPGAKEQEIVADKEGYARFIVSKPGVYLVTCAHQRENQAGFFGGNAYEQVSHNAALAWRQP